MSYATKILRRSVSLLALAVLLMGCQLGGPPPLSDGPFPAGPTDAPYVLVLGTAQDGGCPQLGADHELARRSRTDSRLRRLVASLLVVDPRSGKRWLIDATPDLRAQERRSRAHPQNRPQRSGRPPLYDGVFLTHAHIGHYAGLLHFGREAYGAEGQPTYGSARMVSFLENNGPWSLLASGGYLRLSTLTPGQAVVLAKDLRIVPLLVPHRAEFTDTLAFRVEGPDRSLLYIPDIDKWHQLEPPIEGEIARVDHALLDGTFFANGEIPGRDMSEIPHPFIEESMTRFASLPPGERAKVVFTHLNHGNPAIDPRGSASAEVEAAGMSVAHDGQIFRL